MNTKTTTSNTNSNVMGADFDFDSIRKGRQRKRARDGKTLAEELAAISPDVANLNVGQTCRIDIPKDYGKSYRSFVMSIVAKVNNLTPKGGEWEGRDFDISGDPDLGENGQVYVRRNADLKGAAIKDPPTRS